MVATPAIIRRVFPNIVWDFPYTHTSDTLFLTFDDGPIPEVTPWVLSVLKKYKAKATFFCVGENVVRYPEVYQRILDEGHAVGSHTFKHINGWKTSYEDYIADVKKASEVIKTKIFRPPYGKITPMQLKFVRTELKYRLVMWDILSKDFVRELPEQDCFYNVIDYAKPGSVIVFHDSLKTARKLQYVLPKILEMYRSEGYRFDVIK